MCGRYVRRSGTQKIAEWFQAGGNLDELPLSETDFNVAPSTPQPIIRQSRATGERELILARWGLVPFFTKDLKDVKGISTINARAEAILHARDYDRWLDRAETERLPVDLLRPFEADAMEMHQANPKVNNVRNNGPEMLSQPSTADGF